MGMTRASSSCSHTARRWARCPSISSCMSCPMLRGSGRPGQRCSEHGALSPMFQALHATSETLRDFLQTSIDADPFFGTVGHPWRDRGMHVRLQTPAEMVQGNNDEGVSFWLYRVIRDEERLNDPARRISPTQLRPPPLPVRLHYLATPLTNRTNQGDPDTEQYVLGKILQIFHSK